MKNNPTRRSFSIPNLVKFMRLCLNDPGKQIISTSSIELVLLEGQPVFGQSQNLNVTFEKSETLSRKRSFIICQAPSDKSAAQSFSTCARAFSLSSSYYVRLLNRLVSSEYKVAWPDEKLPAAELDNTRRMLEARKQ